MFVVSQFILNKSGICKNTQQTSTYSIALGLILYSSVYLYILFYNNEYLNIFNKFIIYIVVIDLLLSAFYYFSIQKQDESFIQFNEPLIDENEDEDEDNEENEYDTDVDQEQDEEEEEDDLEEGDDDESQQFINNLIAQARDTEHQRLSTLVEDENEGEVEQSEQTTQPEITVEVTTPTEEIEPSEIKETKKKSSKKSKQVD